MSHFARTERQALADLMLEVGPDAPTLCEGWTVADLAAHLVIRERRPDAALGLVVPLSAAASHGERVRRKLRDTDTFGELVTKVRTPGGIARIPGLDEQMNLIEYTVHHEDVRRAAETWTARQLPADQLEALRGALRRAAGLMTRHLSDTRIVLADTTGQIAVLHDGNKPTVTITGDPVELALFLTGRRTASRVDVTGDEPQRTRVADAKFGM
jgi:uncharacterized protein (TIGR03085 family)